jgi:hypothetical protein
MLEIINSSFTFLWNSFFALSGWQMLLWIIYTIYFLIRMCYYYSNANDYGVVIGYRLTVFGRDTHIRLWHIIRLVFEIPMAIIGLLLPTIKRTLTLQVYEFKTEKKKENE